MERSGLSARLPAVVRALLIVDALFEAAMGGVLLGVVGEPEQWLDVGQTALLVVASLFFTAAIALAVAFTNRSTSLSFVRQLAWANVAGGVVVWAWIALRWPDLQPEGRSLAILAADGFIALAVLEWLAARRLPQGR